MIFLSDICSGQNFNKCDKNDIECIHGEQDNPIYELTDEEREIFSQPVLKTKWGFQVNWTDENWDRQGRAIYVSTIKDIEAKRNQLKKFTELGYKLEKIPTELYQGILEERRPQKTFPETCEALYPTINCKIFNDKGQFTRNKNNTFNLWVNFDKKIERRIRYKLKPILEKFAGVPLKEKATIYGIRRYLPGSRLNMHVDGIPERIISAILQIDQKTDIDWPLELVDHSGIKREFILKPGEMLLYESATVIHGRPRPFQGEFYDNLFVHYAIEDNDIFKKEM